MTCETCKRGNPFFIHRPSKTRGKSLCVAAFDLDYTLLKPKSGCKFPKDRNDAELVFPCIREKLIQLMSSGYKIVIFTNQTGKISDEDLFYKINTYLPNGCEYDVYAARVKFPNTDIHTKPSPSMFDHFMGDNGPVSHVFYVGDAAGRASDFSNTDSLFAANIGVPFYTPEGYFLDSIETIQIPPKLVPLIESEMPKIGDNTIVLLVGLPGCGKSTFARTFEHVISNDVTRSTFKSLEKLRSLRGESIIVIDNTNYTREMREPYIQFAKKNGYTITCILFNVSMEYAFTMNMYRSYTTGIKCIPKIAYQSLIKKYEKPSVEEGIDIIMEYVPSIPEKALLYRFC